jgi:hypothetical protein
LGLKNQAGIYTKIRRWGQTIFAFPEIAKICPIRPGAAGDLKFLIRMV